MRPGLKQTVEIIPLELTTTCTTRHTVTMLLNCFTQYTTSLFLFSLDVLLLVIIFNPMQGLKIIKPFYYYIILPVILKPVYAISIPQKTYTY